MRLTMRVVLELAAVSAVAAGVGVPAAGATATATAVPGAGGSPVGVVWRSGRAIRASTVDGHHARTILRLRTASDVLPSPSPDGGRVVLVADGRVLSVDVAGDGAVRQLGALPAEPVRDGLSGERPVPRADLVRWSPDGTRVAVVADTSLLVCDTSLALRGCTSWSHDVVGQFGATWSPAGDSMAIVAAPSDREGNDRARLVTTDGDATRTVDPLRRRGAIQPYPDPPVWGRSGLAWSTLDLRFKDGELDGILRARVRRVANGQVRTLTAGRPRTALPFAVVGERADGTLLGVRTVFLRDAVRYDLRTMDAAGRNRSAGVALGTLPDDGLTGAVHVLGTLADGRVAVVAPSPRSRTLALRLATIGTGRGPVVRQASEIGVATALPGNPVGD